MFNIQMLLQEPQLDEAVRAGDCLALLIEHFYDAGDHAAVLRYIRELNARKIIVSSYVDADILEDVLKATKEEKIAVSSEHNGDDDDDDGVIGEEIDQV